MTFRNDFDLGKTLKTNDKKTFDLLSIPTAGGGTSRGRVNPLSRAEKSLTALTTKFMTLLQESPNGILDLRSVSFVSILESLFFSFLK
jgi:hypothetical protein